MAEQKDNISISPKTLGLVLAGFTVFVSSVPVGVVKFFPESRSDPCTGTQCRSIQREINSLVVEIDDHSERLSTVEAQCERRSEKLEDRFLNHVRNGHPDSVKEGVDRNHKEIQQLRELINRYFRGSI